MAKPHKRSLRRQIVTATSIFTILLSAVLACVLYIISDRYVRRAAVRSVDFNLQLVASNVGRTLSEAEGLVSWCGNEGSVRRYLSDTTGSGQRLLTAFNDTSTAFSSSACQQDVMRLIVTNEDNSRLLQFGSQLSSSRALTATSANEFPYIGTNETGGWSYLEADPLLPLHPQALIFYRPIRYGTERRYIGGTYIELSLSALFSPLNGYQMTTGSRLYYCFSGETFEAADNTLTYLPDFQPGEDVSADYELSASCRLTRTALNGEDCLLVLCPIDAQGNYVAQSLPESAFLGQRMAFLTLIALGILVIQLMSRLLTNWLDRIVSMPVTRLQERIRAVGGGDFSADHTLEWNNELGDIGRGINELAHNVDSLMQRRLEDQRQNQELEYKMLQNEINPHFIYNTLNSIRWMATIQHAPGIAEMVTALSRLLKSVSKGNEKLVPLHDELALLNDYFTIQQYRYGGDIYMDVSYIEDEKICRDCLIPRFTLQPLAENAIFHGLEPRGGTGNVMLDIRMSGSDVSIKLSDDGVGMPPAQLERALKAPEGEEAEAKFRHVGLWNVHRRLQYAFGPDYGLSLESEEGIGTTVTVRLPYHTKEENAHDADTAG